VVRIHENPEFNYLGLTCGSQIGRLLKIIDADGTRSSLTLQFAFTPGNCIQVAGRTLDLELRKSNSNSQVIFARLLKNFELRNECTTTIGNDIGGLKPITQCEWKQFPVYYQGLFRR
jgi:hypothetical protein